MRQPLEDGTVMHRPRRHVADFPGALHAGGRHESLSVRISQRPHPRMPLHAAHDPALHFEDLRPLLDRIDIHIDVPAVNYKELRSTKRAGKLSADSRARCSRPRDAVATLLLGARKVYCNAQMPTQLIRKFCELSADCERLLERAMAQQGLSARAHDRILKVARTIADLDGMPQLEPKHIAEAIQYRTLDRTYWA